MKPKALLFDVFGTIVDWRNSIANDLGAFFGQRGVSRDWFQFADDWRALYQPAMQRVRNGERGYVRLDQLHLENLQALLPRYALELNDSELDHVNRVWHRLEPWPDVASGLTRLKKPFILATLSNGNIELMVNLARHAGLPWDMILGSELARNYKPEPATYLLSMDLLGLEPNQCLMVAAHNDDLRQARHLGMQTAFVTRPTEYGAQQSRDLMAEENWDYITDSIGGLATSLQC